MGSQKDLFVKAAATTGEMAWPVPLPGYLKENLQSNVADIANSASKREAGMLIAGVFLQEFVGDAPWIHIDVAGPGFNTASPWGYTPKGGTGYGIRTLIKLMENL